VFKSDRCIGKQSDGSRVIVSCLIAGAFALAMATGCSQSVGESGYSNQRKTQLQFYSPPGATVTVKGSSTRSHQIAEYGAYENRLEQNPEEFCVFNLSPGRYEFKYVSAPGLPGVSVYGELDIRRASSDLAKIFQRRAFVPIALPSMYYQEVAIQGDEMMPYRGESYRYAIDEQDISRLKMGDVVEKVIFVADLEAVEHELAETRKEIALYELKLDYANKRFQIAYREYIAQVYDELANWTKSDREHYEWEEERQECMLALERLGAKLQRLENLLGGDHVLARRGMMVLATEEVVTPHRDPVDAAADLGEILVVMRLGGRHMHWGEPRTEMAAYKP
jgi:hypothetical protein